MMCANGMALNETYILAKATSKEAMCNWYTYCMDVGYQIVSRRFGPIGFLFTTVEIYEGMFGSRKYDRGRFVKGRSVLEDIKWKVGRVFLYRVISGTVTTLPLLF
ncbi:hypothetical protein RF11_13269 [Thelohanellus kitauei]|uniref:Uncharacterized protein n=1 Tax=Thelohanellus kitauei TaxID=669202 RepID=A0A0C2NEY3_THEKT|nr:hypothetical protein RF11_13269 [Thelohanellus kitauei]